MILIRTVLVKIEKSGFKRDTVTLHIVHKETDRL